MKRLKIAQEGPLKKFKGMSKTLAGGNTAWVNLRATSLESAKIEINKIFSQENSRAFFIADESGEILENYFNIEGWVEELSGLV